MVTLRVLRRFRDLHAHVTRMPGETFQATEGRAEELLARLPHCLEAVAADVAPATEEEPATDLASASVAELRALCKERGIKVPARAKKADILALLDRG